MVSFNVYRATSSGAYIEGVCLASDEKPIVGISNGSILYAVDASDGTTTRYMFDQSTASWIEAECPCGGGSGGGEGGGVFIVHADGSNGDGEPAGTLDATFNQIKAARDAGQIVLLYGESSTSDPLGDNYYSCPLIYLCTVTVGVQPVVFYRAEFSTLRGSLSFTAADPDTPMTSGGVG